ncbi:hypothetical protein H6G27_20460 [Nostoc linckia FACHB-104]|nr:hypothetical protein [Nostoc linckia FACHB-104]
MTTVANAALLLDECLSQQLSRHTHRNLVSLSQNFQKQLSKIIAVPWMMATSEDFRFATTCSGTDTSKPVSTSMFSYDLHT